MIRMSSIQFMYNYKKQLNQAYERQTKLFEQADGSVLHRPSDNPVDYSKLLRYNTADSENEQYQRNVDTAASWMKTSDDAAVHITDAMKTINERTVSAANDHNNEQDFKSTAKEVYEFINEIVATSNTTQHGSRYVFSGQKDMVQPFLMSEEEYNRGLAKTLDSDQIAYFKNDGTRVDRTATLSQLLTLEDDSGNLYYLDTNNGYFYTKDFVDNGYKDVISSGRAAVKPTLDAAGKIGLDVDAAWQIVNNTADDDLQSIIDGTADMTDSKFQELAEALRVIGSEDSSTVANNLTSAETDLTNSWSDLTVVNTADITWNYYTSSTASSTKTSAATQGDVFTNTSAASDIVSDLENAIGFFSSDSNVSTADITSNLSGMLNSVTNLEDTNTSINPATPDTSKVGDLITAKLVSLASEKCKDNAAPEFKVSHAFNSRGMLREGLQGLKADELETTGFLNYEKGEIDHEGNQLYSVTGLNVTIDGKETTLKFATIQQQIITYNGDENKISMVKLNGATDPGSDTVNLTGQDLYGSDIFDDENSGNGPPSSGSAMLNQLLTVHAKMDAGDSKWLSSDGVTVADVAHATVVISETKLGARQQLYTSVKDMLENQSDTITEDITNVSASDVAQMATKLMELTTLYNMSLSLGGRILPQSLADYL